MSQKLNWEQKIAMGLRQCKPEKTSDLCRVIVELSGAETDEIKYIINLNKGKLFRENSIISSIVVEIPYSAIQTLAKSKQVKKIWSDNPIKTCVK